jgi:cytochrome c biogenesis factor
MEKIRKLSVITGLLLLVAMVVVTLFDPYPVIPFIQEFMENEKTVNFPIAYFSTAFAILSSILLISIILFYFYSWKGNRKAVAFFAICYACDLVLMVIEWKPAVNLELVNFLTNLNAFTDGVIVCTFIIPDTPLSQQKLE